MKPPAFLSVALLVLSFLLPAFGEEPPATSTESDKAKGAPSEPATVKLPHYGVFLRLKDGTIKELEPKPYGRAQWIEGNPKFLRAGDFLSLPNISYTYGKPEVEIDPGEFQDLLIYGSDIGKPSGSIDWYHDLKNAGGRVWGVTLKEGETTYVTKGVFFGPQGGLRMAPLGNETLRLFYPDPKKAASMEKLCQNGLVEKGKTTTANALGVSLGQQVYQFGIKRAKKEKAEAKEEKKQEKQQAKEKKPPAKAGSP